MNNEYENLIGYTFRVKCRDSIGGYFYYSNDLTDANNVACRLEELGRENIVVEQWIDQGGLRWIDTRSI